MLFAILLTTGVYTFKKTGAKFEGQYDDGLKRGKGTFTYPDGSVYTGEYRDDKMNGTDDDDGGVIE